jgi:hypothetical protein
MSNPYEQMVVDLTAKDKRRGANPYDAMKAPEPVEFSAMEMLTNIPSSGKQYGEDILSMIMHPIDTTKAIGGLGMSALSKGQRNVQELAAGVEIPEGEDEALANAVMQAGKERYGSVDALKRTLMEDPVGALGDVAGLTGVGGAAKIPGMARVASAIEPLSIASKAPRALANKVDPQKLYQSAVKFSTTMDSGKRKAAIQTALDQGLMPTAKGVEKLEGSLAELNSGLNKVIAESVNSGERINTKEVFRYINDLRKTKGGTRIEADKDLAEIDKIVSGFEERMIDQDFMTPAELQDFKVDAYDKINWDVRNKTGTPVKEDTFKTMARASKDAMEAAVPETHGLNAQLGDLYNLRDPLTKAQKRLDNRNLISINTPMNIGGGGLIGQLFGSVEAGTIGGMVVSVLSNPKAKAKIAIGLNKIQKGDLTWLEKNLSRSELNVAMAISGRLEEVNQETSQ